MTQHYSKRERLASILDWLYLRSGLLKQYDQTDYKDIQRIVFVCKGNICRSAYAEGKLKAMGFNAASLGIRAVDGRYANETALRVAAGRGVDLRSHRTQSLRNFDAHPGDLFVCMERNQAKEVLSKHARVALLGMWIGIPRIRDPYGKPEKIFNDIFDQIDTALLEIGQKLKNNPK